MMKRQYPLALAGMLATMMLMPGGAQAEEFCREYTRTISIGGRLQEGYGQACLMPDGDWRIRTEQVRYMPPSNLAWRETQPVYSAPDVVYYRQQPVRVVFVDPPGKKKGWHKHNRHADYRYDHRRHDHHPNHKRSRH